MKSFGFFAEEYGTGPSWREAVAPAPQRHALDIARYLGSASVVLMAPEPTGWDGDGEGRVVRSDGEWVWPHGLAVLVRDHQVHVPDELVERMRAAGFAPPTLDEAASGRVVDELIADGVLALEPETVVGDPFAAPIADAVVPPEVLAELRSTLAHHEDVTGWDYTLAAGLDPDGLEADGGLRADGSLDAEVRAEMAARLGWHPPDPAVERAVDAVLEGFVEVLLGRAERLDAGALDALERRADRPGFWVWLAASVIETRHGSLILYPPATIELLVAVLGARGDAARVEASLGPLRMAGLRALASVEGVARG